MSRKLSFFLALPILALAACQSGSKAPADAAMALKSELKKYEKKICVTADTCYTLTASFPVLSGGNAEVTDRITQAIQATYRGLADLNGIHSNLPFETMLDSVSAAMGNAFVKFRQDEPSSASIAWNMNINGNVPVITNKIITVRVDEDSYTGGAHPNASSSIITYDLKTGNPLALSDLLSNSDEALPLLEKAYLADKGKPEGNLSEFLFPEMNGKLPLPKNAAIDPNGIRFVYNSYEVAPYAVGPADLLLTWEQLGNLADKKKWME
jgi:hypothetical protein